MTLKKQVKLAKMNGTYEELRSNLIEKKIHERYSIGQEIALNRQREEKPEDFKAYYDYAEQCKKEVDALLASL